MLSRLWKVWVAAMENGLATEDLFFDIGDTYSPYMEVSLKDLHMEEGGKLEQRIAVNPFYSWDGIFSPLLEGRASGYEELILSLADLVLHHLAGLDACSGISKDEYLARRIAEDIGRGLYGKDGASLFSVRERRQIASLLLALYRTGENFFCMEEAFRIFYPDTQLFLQERDAVFLYLRMGEEPRTKSRLTFLFSLFLSLEYRPVFYWNCFPGVIGIDETMITGKFIIG